MSDHEAPTTEAPTNGTGSDEAAANETPQHADDAAERVDQARQIAELEDAWRRTAAELDNFRKRCARDVLRGREQERAAVAASWLRESPRRPAKSSSFSTRTPGFPRARSRRSRDVCLRRRKWWAAGFARNSGKDRRCCVLAP